MAMVNQSKKRRAGQSTARRSTRAIAETAKLLRSAASGEGSSEAVQKKLLANVLRAFDTNAPRSALPPEIKLSPRMRQTLDRLLLGDSEKQIATSLQVSQHTVHVYVKSVYKQFDVNSRGELLARFIHPPTGSDR